MGKYTDLNNYHIQSPGHSMTPRNARHLNHAMLTAGVAPTHSPAPTLQQADNVVKFQPAVKPAPTAQTDIGIVLSGILGGAKDIHADTLGKKQPNQSAYLKRMTQLGCAPVSMPGMRMQS